MRGAKNGVAAKKREPDLVAKPSVVDIKQFRFLFKHFHCFLARTCIQLLIDVTELLEGPGSEEI